VVAKLFKVLGDEVVKNVLDRNQRNRWERVHVSERREE
jgi:hypothetical protein